MSLAFTPHDRLLVLAPHPDVESLACAGLIQRVLAAGGDVFVVIGTDGDSNPWPQRLVERRLRLGSGAAARWGARRQKEARAALQGLGVDEAHVRFLHWRDQGLTRRLHENAAESVETLQRLLAAFAPTLVAAPALNDSHPDHSALALLLRAALEGMKPRPRVLAYWLHGRPSAQHGRHVLALTPGELARKRDAALAHWTQTRFGRGRLLAYATPTESFFDEAPASPPQVAWRWCFPRLGPLAMLGIRSVRVVGITAAGELRATALDLRGQRPPGLVLRRLQDGALQVAIAPLWPDVIAVHAKLDHRHRAYVYDTCPWRPASPATHALPEPVDRVSPEPRPARVDGKGGERPRPYGTGMSSAREPDMRPWKILCDFDGTICLPDATDALLEQLAHPDWKAIERDWRSGRIGSRECMTRQVALIDGSERDVEAVLDGIRIDPLFPAFAAQAQGLGVEIAIVSDGLDWTIHHLLRRHGLEHLPVVANRFERVSSRGWQLSSPHARTECIAGSGNCKCAWAATAQRTAGNARVLLIGDGQSDVCVSARADFVFAKDRLLAHCRSAGLPHRAIGGFADAVALLPDLVAGRLQPDTPVPASIQAEPA